MNFRKYLTYPIYDFLLHPSHTALFRSYSATSCEGCERRRLCQVFLFRFNKFSLCLSAFVFHFLYLDTPSLQTTLHTFRFVLESHELTDIQADGEIMKDHFFEFIRCFVRRRRSTLRLYYLSLHKNMKFTRNHPFFIFLYFIGDMPITL